MTDYYIDEDGWKIPTNGDNAPSSAYKIIETSLRLSIPPVFSNDPKSGATEMLDSLVMRYVPALGAVLLTHINTQFSQSAGLILDESPFSVTDVKFTALVWSPTNGQRMRGKVTLCSPDHISLLVHHTFNVTIPREYIDCDNFKYASDSSETGSGGRWVHKSSTQVLAEVDRELDFTVVERVTSNQMLTLTASLLDIHRTKSKSKVEKRRKSDSDNAPVDDTRVAKKAKIPIRTADSSDERTSDSSDSDSSSEDEEPPQQTSSSTVEAKKLKHKKK
ncbi:hypothetical protein E3Q22_04324 [Wallemia mellicola]|uniref:RPA43 OB domain-containing protein n=1 Tax=Wallemia mellicola TaxID=1708541 RepID=A0A4T0LU31_9BASI|nr:hypothetical protein E3Q22_04324 [Wallemia mellicola]